MGKKNSKLKQDTIDRLTTDTYCKYCIHDRFIQRSFCKINEEKENYPRFPSIIGFISISRTYVLFRSLRIFFHYHHAICTPSFIFVDSIEHDYPPYSDVLPFRYGVSFDMSNLLMYILQTVFVHITYTIYIHTHICCHFIKPYSSSLECCIK